MTHDEHATIRTAARPRTPLTYAIRCELSTLRAGLLRCRGCRAPATILRRGTDPHCALCARVATQRRYVTEQRTR
jgi:hypothetical protein